MTLATLSKTADVFQLSVGQKVGKGNLFALIQHSKVKGSEYWSGEPYKIGNTPQQGINWVGAFPELYGVIIKSKDGWYKKDDWQGDDQTSFSYSFKAVNGVVNRNEKANLALINQPEHGYPILLFSDVGDNYEYQGMFSVADIGETGVTLKRYEDQGFIEPTKRKVMPEQRPKSVKAERLKGGRNLIYYGAPGTGKSWKIEHMIKDQGGSIIRTVFHPDVQNSDFIGTLKPIIIDDHVGYGFSPGPFAKAYVKALNTPEQMTWLVIEELNRAPAASVFGELFLLLDRDGSGSGIYDVDCPSEEFGKWLEVETGDGSGKMRLLSNLNIVCTMNSADQGVYPLDTAFRRRWEQDYIPLQYDEGPKELLKISTKSGVVDIAWLRFVESLNHLLLNNGVPEDRLIGPWFIKSSEFLDTGQLPNKLLIYLWDDVFRTHGRETVFDTAHIKTFGELTKWLTVGKQIFSQALLDGLGANA